MAARYKYVPLCMLILVTAVAGRTCFMLQVLPTALWVSFFYFCFRMLLPDKPALSVAILTMAFSVLVEYSQLYHSLWTDRLRQVVVVHFLIGSTFDPADIYHCLLGILAAFVSDKWFLR